MTPLIGKTHKPSRDMIAIECTNIRRKRSEGNKRVEKDIGSDTSSIDNLRVLHGSVGGDGRQGGCPLLGYVGPIRVVDGIYLPRGFPFLQGGE